MTPGRPSLVARRLAAHRLTFERVPWAGGSPAADAALALDIAGGTTSAPGPAREHLRARTAFYDRAVVRAHVAGITQFVTCGPRYDGRSLRYGHDATRWFELDDEAIQLDKRRRLARLGIAAEHVRFLPLAFDGAVAATLTGAGLDADQPTLFLLESAAVYLRRHAVRSLLADLRSVAAQGSVLAVSLPSSTGPAATLLGQSALRTAAAALGEPVLTWFRVGDRQHLLAATGWLAVAPPEAGEPVPTADLVLAVPTDDEPT